MLLQDNSFTLKKKHLELDGVVCKEDENLIGGHCVKCGELCSTCTYPNTDGLIYGFYLGDDYEAIGSCTGCG